MYTHNFWVIIHGHIVSPTYEYYHVTQYYTGGCSFFFNRPNIIKNRNSRKTQRGGEEENKDAAYTCNIHPKNTQNSPNQRPKNGANSPANKDETKKRKQWV
jgi:hypothetical protein